MLPRTKMTRAIAAGFAIFSVGSVLGQAPVQGFVQNPPSVSVHDFVPQSHEPFKLGNKFVLNILAKSQVDDFTLVGVTWQGTLRVGTQFQVKVHDQLGWSTWQTLNYSLEHGPDANSAEARLSRFGTDPLITSKSDGIQVRAVGKTRTLPEKLKVSLINSNTTSFDINTFKSAKQSVGLRRNFGAVTTKSGAVVSRPNIVSREQWGADESWRDRTPRVSSKIIAGFIHHTATTNSYNPEDGPAQMRSLYAYFTKSLKYSDMGYNFLVDRYGVVYEGRAGCVPGAGAECDGPSKAVIGAHTAGMNDNTFAISAIGNFQIGAIDKATATVMTKAIAGLMAWKIAPYNLDPTAMANIPSTDTSGLSQYSNGSVATVPVISGHRDVGRTVCPGKYLYALVPQIRNQISALMVGRIQNVSVVPIEQRADDASPISLTAKVPVSGTWNVTVTDAESGTVVYAQSGTQEGKPNFLHEWDHTDSTGHLVPPGNYAVSISVTVAERQLPTETTMVTLASKPDQMTGVKLKRISGSSVLVSWPTQIDSVPLIDAIYYRTSSNKGKTWGSWIRLPDTATEQIVTSGLVKRRIFIEVKQTNSIGDSLPIRLSFSTKS